MSHGPQYRPTAEEESMLQKIESGLTEPDLSFLDVGTASEQLELLAKSLKEKISALERDSQELGNIRATLKVNFKDGNEYGVHMKDGSTINMLLSVLEQLTTRPPVEVKK